jgi:hypothetical protein
MYLCVKKSRQGTICTSRINGHRAPGFYSGKVSAAQAGLTGADPETTLKQVQGDGRIAGQGDGAQILVFSF